MKPRSRVRWLCMIGAAALLMVGPARAADVHVIISAGAIFFAGALTQTVQRPEAAGALIRFLASSEAAPAILHAGLMPIPER
jgi:hypothetical protein